MSWAGTWAGPAWRRFQRGPMVSDGSAQAGVEPVQRLYRRSVDPYLEVQVVAGGRAGGTDPADQVALAYLLPGVHQDDRLVAVARGQPLALVHAVVDAGVVAVPPAPAGLDHNAVAGDVDRGAARRGQVDSGVQLPDPVVGVVAHSEVAGLPPVHRGQEVAAVQAGDAPGAAADLGRDPADLLLQRLVLGEGGVALGVGRGHGLLLLGDERGDVGLVLLGRGLRGQRGVQGGTGPARGGVGRLLGQGRLVLRVPGGDLRGAEAVQGALLLLRRLLQVVQPVHQV